MSEEPNVTPEVRTIRQLVRLMQRYDLTAIDVDEGARKIRLRRRGAEVIPAASGPIASTPVAPSLPTPSVVPTPSAATPAGIFIESPMVGTFYASPSPDAPPFLNVGSLVRNDTTIGIIEAMKVFTDIPAGISGKVVECLVKSGQSVEFGQPLFRVEPS